MSMTLIAAVADNGVIGNSGELPFYLPADLKHFRETTTGHAIVMGRKTLESIGKILPGRDSIVLTRDENYTFPGAHIVHSIDEINRILTALGRDNEEAFGIGGGEIYRELFGAARKLVITEVHTKPEGDVYFPAIEEADWTEISRDPHEGDDKNPFEYEFVIYERKSVQ